MHKFLTILGLMTSLFSLSSALGQNSKSACGLLGSIEERIANCSTSMVAKGSEWKLVTRAESGNKEVWRDESTGLLWSDNLDTVYSKPHASDVCTSSKSLSARGNLTEPTWSLPSRLQYLIAENHGVREILPNIARRFFWTSSFETDYGYGGWVFLSSDARFYYYPLYEAFYVRCVGH